MTSLELYLHMIELAGSVEKPFPETMEVDAETFANICQEIFNKKAPQPATTTRVIQISIGKNNGIFFKGVEIILKQEKT